MSAFFIDYFIFVFLFALGAIQITASLNGLIGILFFHKPLVARILGLTIIIVAIVWFYLSSDRNLNDVYGGLDANDQSGLFALGVIAALFLTLVISSITNIGRLNNETIFSENEGLGNLTMNTYYLALSRNLRYWIKQWNR